MEKLMSSFNDTPLIVRAIPNENWEIIIEFEGNDFRVFKSSIAINEKGMSFLAYPQKFKAFTVTPSTVNWKRNNTLDSNYLFKHSTSIDKENLQYQSLRLEYKNQAPTKTHKTHHVYGVYLRPFNEVFPFVLGESIGGGHGEMGHDDEYSLQKMLENKNWREHFNLSGCEWAIPVVEENCNNQEKLITLLVNKIQERCANA